MDMGQCTHKSPSPCNTCIPVSSYKCMSSFATNTCAHTHARIHAHTHAHTHTHIFIFYNIYILFYQIGLYIIILYHEKKLWCLERLSLSLFHSVAVVKVRVWENLSHKSHCVLYDYRNPRVVSMAVCHLWGLCVCVCVVPTV